MIMRIKNLKIQPLKRQNLKKLIITKRMKRKYLKIFYNQKIQLMIKCNNKLI